MKKLICGILATINLITASSVYAAGLSSSVNYNTYVKTPHIGKYSFTLEAFEKPSKTMIPTIRNKTEYFPTTVMQVYKEVDNLAPTALYQSQKVGKVDVVFATGQLNDLDTYVGSMDSFETALKNPSNSLDAVVQKVKTEEIESLDSIEWTEAVNTKYGTIEITNGGKDITIKGNTAYQGRIFTWTEYDNALVEQNTEFRYSLDFGDSIASASMILGGNYDNGLLTCYALVFPNTMSELANKTNRKVSIVKFSNVNTSTNSIQFTPGTDVEVIGQISAKQSGYIHYSVTKEGITIESREELTGPWVNYRNVTDIVIADVKYSPVCMDYNNYYFSKSADEIYSVTDKNDAGDGSYLICEYNGEYWYTDDEEVFKNIKVLTYEKYLKEYTTAEDTVGLVVNSTIDRCNFIRQAILDNWYLANDYKTDAEKKQFNQYIADMVKEGKTFVNNSSYLCFPSTTSQVTTFNKKGINSTDATVAHVDTKYKHLGFMSGFIVEYYNHGCGNIGKFDLVGINIENRAGKSLAESLSSVSWRDGAARVIINSSDVQPNDLQYLNYLSDKVKYEDYNSDEYKNLCLGTISKLIDSNAYVINLGSDTTILDDNSIPVLEKLLQYIGVSNGTYSSSGVTLNQLLKSIEEKPGIGCVVDSTNKLTGSTINNLWSEVIQIIKAVVNGKNKGPEDWILVNTEVKWETTYDDAEHDIPWNITSNQHSTEQGATITFASGWSVQKSNITNKIITDTVNFNKHNNLNLERWRYTHNKDYFDNSDRQASFSGEWQPEPVTLFSNVGLYRINYKRKDNPLSDASENNKFSSYRRWSTNYDYKITE